MTPHDWLLRGRQIALGDSLEPAILSISGAKIVAIEPYDATCPVEMDCGDLIVMPGLVDTHVHFNEPGRTHWEGIESGTRAAAAGGVTTVIEMPLNSIPATLDAASLAAKRARLEGRTWVDIGFWGGLVPENVDHLDELLEAGVFGLKAFLVDSGVPEFGATDAETLHRALDPLQRHGVPLLVHAEHPAELRLPPSTPPDRYSTYLATRPASSELRAIEWMVAVAREHPLWIHIVHLAAPEALDVIGAAQASGARLTVETCPHYLSFGAEQIPDAATQFKCAPPIRDTSRRNALWQGLIDGRIDFIASDHSPCPPEDKLPGQGDFVRAWGGIAGIELSLPAVWTGARARGVAVSALVPWLCAKPAELAGLHHRKGRIAPGYDADLVVWDHEASCTVDAARLHQRHPITPYAGLELFGVVKTTVLRGSVVYRNGEFTDLPRGTLLERSSHD